MRALRSWCRRKLQTVCRPDRETRITEHLSLAVQYYADPYIVANVPPNCFMPRPKVGSAVIRLTRHAGSSGGSGQMRSWMFDIIRASFNQRRKTLANGLTNADKMGSPERSDRRSNRDVRQRRKRQRRALSLDEFARLSNEIYNYLHSRIS